jgi:hypothetical protein
VGAWVEIVSFVGCPLIFVGKIISKTGQDNYLIRFTSVPPEISSFFQAIRLHASKED